MIDFSESVLIEEPAIALFAELEWETVNCLHETFGPGGTLGRETAGEVVLLPRLRAALEKLNPDLPESALAAAVEEIIRDRSAMDLPQANRELYRLLKDGVRVTFRGEDGEETVARARVIDWENPVANDFLLASQFWVSGELYRRRIDLLGFVNGLPLLFVELKAAHRRLEHAYRRNLRDYKSTVPHLFWYNALIVLSNGSDSRVGSLTAEWEHFGEWKRINSEGEQGVVSLETVVRGTCARDRFLDLVENFTLFSEARGGLIKLVAKNHQYLGVNNAIQAVRDLGRNQGRLGVFWHTQGSGKTYSMLFFSQKILRKLPGNWAFVVITDRQELDDQAYRNFAACGVLTPADLQATSAEHLRELLAADRRYLFTLIQKFHGRDGPHGRPHPVLSARADVIVMTDEAHRSQYDHFALNMRNALPRAAFIGFTGTPLMAGEERTRQVFGDYVSVYNFKQAIDDGATVPLYYENRIPELQLANEHLNEEMQRLLEEAELDEEQERKLEREFGREYHLVTRDDRLERVAQDIVAHFTGRGHLGKAMVVSIDKATAVRMYDKVRRHWARALGDLVTRRAAAEGPEAEAIDRLARYMAETDMAVVVSPSQNEVEEFREKGLDILLHRRRMINEDLETKFKDPQDPFRIVFVCAMWMTGFDVPSCSTIYLDKPMRNHTLMQTIARANRVFPEKVNGLIVDYVGVFRDLQRALAIYGSAAGGERTQGDSPVQDKRALVAALQAAIADAEAFCRALDIDLDAIPAASGLQRVRLLEDGVEAILVSDASRKRYLTHAGLVDRLYRAILPDHAANRYAPRRALLAVLAEKIRSLSPEVDISDVMNAVEELLDRSIAAEGYVIREPEGGDLYTADRYVDLSQIDFEALRRHFERGHRRTEAEKLKNALQRKVADLVRLNRTRLDYVQKLQELIDEYNAGSTNVETFFAKLTAFAQALSAEEQRAIAEQLTEEELVLFDLLTRPEMRLTAKEERAVKKVARELLAVLKEERLVLDWRKRQQSRAAVRLTIDEKMDELPRAFTPELYQRKCDAVYQHVYDSYFGQGRSIYTRAA